jgi:hypothetical protein
MRASVAIELPLAIAIKKRSVESVLNRHELWH